MYVRQRRYSFNFWLAQKNVVIKRQIDGGSSGSGVLPRFGHGAAPLSERE